MLMSSDESEMVKLMTNSFFAVKVAFFNECRCLADKLKMRWEDVVKGVLSDGRISHSHTKVPGPDGRFGFGGACLPKDLSMLCQTITDNHLSALVMSAAGMRNAGIDRRDS